MENEYTKTVCTADKKATVTVYTDDACTSVKTDSADDELVTVYDYSDLTSCIDGSDFSYKFAEPTEETEPTPESGSALMATTVAALALIASQF